MLTLPLLRHRLPSAACLAALLLFAAAPASATETQDRGQRDRGQQKERPAQGGAKDKPAQGGARDKPARGGTQDRPAQGGTRDKPAKGAERDQPAQGRTRDEPAGGGVRDEPANRAERGGRGGRGEATRDLPGDRPGERGTERATDKVTDRPAPPATVDAARTKQLHTLERSHRRRVARIERLREIYRAEGNEGKLAELERMAVRETNLYEGKVADHEKDLGAEQVQRVLRDLPKRGEGRGQRGERPDRGTTDKPGDRPTDKPSDKPSDRSGDKPADRGSRTAGGRGEKGRDR